MPLIKETIPGSKSFIAASDVYLEAGHICIKKNTTEKIFVDETVVLNSIFIFISEIATR